MKRVNWLSLATLALAGCGGVLDPHGPVGASEKLILLDSLAIMLVIVVPVILATFGCAWWFRASNRRASYRPDWSFSGTLELLVWAVPTIVITFLGGIAWTGSHVLDPYRALPSRTKALEIEVISLDWKWLFIYPAQHLATLNQLVIPVGTPVHFRLTSSGVMNSFFVPQLGSQVYTMAGMTSQLSLQANKPGTVSGLSAQFSGPGFATMHFEVRAITAADFGTWVAGVQASGPPLDKAVLAVLAQPSANISAATFGHVQAGLFDSVVNAAGVP